MEKSPYEGAFIVTLRSVPLRSDARNGRRIPPNVTIKSLVLSTSNTPSVVRAFASQSQNASDLLQTSNSPTNQIACSEVI